MVIWVPLLVFLVSLVADYGTSLAAIRRGFREGNPALAANPVLVALISAGIVIGLGEGFRLAGYSGWQTIYWIASGIHYGLALWNLGMILRKGK